MNRRALHTLALSVALALCACADPPEGPRPSVLDGIDEPDAGGVDVGRAPGEYARRCAAAGEVAGGGARARLCLSPSHAASGSASGGGARLIASPPRALRAHTSSPR